MEKKSRLIFITLGVSLLLLFLIGTTAFSFYSILSFFKVQGFHIFPVYVYIIFAVLDLFVFSVGIVTVYLSSLQLSLKVKILGAIFGWIPILHLVMLVIILSIAIREVFVESAYRKKNIKRKDQKVCETKYPILLVHGVFFRDIRYLNYWGRIPKVLMYNGAKIFYGEQDSALSVKESGKELSERIKYIVNTLGHEKVNIIAHSKGGLDARAAISLYGCEDLVASLTTINTPHRGCEFADFLLEKIKPEIKTKVASVYDKALSKLGDKNPSFLDATKDLTHASTQQLNEELIDSEKVLYESVGSKLNHATNGRFPLNFTFPLVKHFDGANDGLVGLESFKWGSDFKFLEVSGRRGISHGDMIDLNRENIKGFDIREFYVELVSNLKNRGY